MDVLDTLLSRLEKVRANGRNKWMACCPAHDDGSPSLGVKMADSGVILVHCFAGCDVDDICAAVGLETWQLFPDGIPPMNPEEREKRKELDHLYQTLRIYNAMRKDGTVGPENHAEARVVIDKINEIKGWLDANSNRAK